MCPKTSSSRIEALRQGSLECEGELANPKIRRDGRRSMPEKEPIGDVGNTRKREIGMKGEIASRNAQRGKYRGNMLSFV
jgi:hypothetical protein